MRTRILPYRTGSQSVRVLAQELGALRLRLEESKYKYREGDLVINWGNSRHEGFPRMLNHPKKVSVAANKLCFFELMKEKCPEIIPKFWTDPNEIPDEAFPIVCRENLFGHSGDGIHIADTRDDLVTAPLYVQYVKKKDEFRVHVGRIWQDFGIGTAVPIGGAVQRKARSLSVPDDEVNWRVRNHSNGFIFQREGFDTPQAVLDAAKRSLIASGLDFGAVDVLWNEHLQKAFVLEINTAPGLEGQTVVDYAKFFRSFLP